MGRGAAPQVTRYIRALARADDGARRRAPHSARHRARHRANAARADAADSGARASAAALARCAAARAAADWCGRPRAPTNNRWCTASSSAAAAHAWWRVFGIDGADAP